MKRIEQVCRIFYCLMLGTSPLVAQIEGEISPEMEQWTQEALTNMAFDGETNPELLENFLLFTRNPIDLNNCEKEDLEILGILSVPQIDSLFSYRENHGDLLTYYELPTIVGFDFPTVYALLPFVKIMPPVPYNKNKKLADRIFGGGRQMAIFRYSRTLQPRRGYSPQKEKTSPAYSGNPDHLYFRYRSYRHRDFSLGLTLEKDPGEAFALDTPHQSYGADFTSFHFMLFEKKRWKKLVVGDYHIQAGQGLLLSSGFGLGKSGIQPTRTRRTSNGITPHTSSMEYGFFRGTAATFQVTERTEITAFASLNQLDASVVEADTLGYTSYASSTTANGLHRTDSEYAKKGGIGRQTWGFHLYQKGRLLKVGLVGIGSIFNKPVLPKTKPYNQFTFRGTKLFNMGLHVDYRWKNLHFFGEGATTFEAGHAAVAGVIATLSSQWETSLVYRKYDRDFHTLYGNGFGESGGTANENGLYWSIRFSPSSHWQFTAYYDRFFFPWLRFRVDTPSDGEEYLLRAALIPNRRTSCYLQYRYEQKALNQTDENQKTRQPIPITKNQLALNIHHQITEKLSVQTRVQGSTTLHEEATFGHALVQDLHYKSNKFALSFRLAAFDTDWNNRQYVYEKDVLYSFSIPAYYGKGTRLAWVGKWKLNRTLRFWAKYGMTHYVDRDEISSGNDVIEGDEKSDVRFQLQVLF